MSSTDSSWCAATFPTAERTAGGTVWRAAAYIKRSSFALYQGAPRGRLFCVGSVGDMMLPAQMMANRVWLRRSWPFAHVVARDVFNPAFYSALSTQLRDLLSKGLSEAPAPRLFSRNIAG